MRSIPFSRNITKENIGLESECCLQLSVSICEKVACNLLYSYGQKVVIAIPLCYAQGRVSGSNISIMEKISFQTSDGVTIVGAYSSGTPGGPSALLLHMMPATKESWEPFTTKLIAAGFSHVLAIDLRGHGESRKGSSGEHLDYELFEDADHMKKIHDVEGAADWMKTTHGVGSAHLAVIGASIGANLSIAYAAADNEIPATAALSPGLDYRGVTTGDAVTRMLDSQALYLAASREDELSFGTDRKLATFKPDAVVMEFDGAGHGTTMFEREPAFMDTLIEWLSGKVS